MNNLEDIQAIEKYLDGRLSDQEMEDLEVRLVRDPSYRNDFEEFKILKYGIIKSAKKTTLSDKLERLHKWSDANHAKRSPKSKTIKLNRNRTKTMLFAAAAASLLLLLFMPTLTLDPTTSEQLFAKYFVPSQNFGAQISRSADMNDPGRQAYLAYDLGDYELASTLFETHLMEDGTHRLTDLYHLANCYLATGQWERAVQTLEEVTQSYSSLSENAKWYLSLAYLRVGDEEKARALLQEVAAPMDRARQARIIFKKLEK